MCVHMPVCTLYQYALYVFPICFVSALLLCTLCALYYLIGHLRHLKSFILFFWPKFLTFFTLKDSRLQQITLKVKHVWQQPPTMTDTMSKELKTAMAARKSKKANLTGLMNQTQATTSIEKALEEFCTVHHAVKGLLSSTCDLEKADD